MATAMAHLPTASLLILLALACNEPSAPSSPVIAATTTSLAVEPTASASTPEPAPTPVEAGVDRIVWGPKGDLLAAWCNPPCDKAGQIGIWNAANGKRRGIAADEQATDPLGVAINATGKWLVTSSRDSLRVFGMDGLEHEQTVESYLVYHRFEVSPDGGAVLWTNGYGVRGLDLTTGKPAKGYDFHDAAAMYAMDVTWAPDSQRAMVNHEYEATNLVGRNANKIAVVQVPNSNRPGVTNVVWSKDSRNVYIAQNDGAVALVNGRTGTVRKVIRQPDPDAPIYSSHDIALSPDDRLLATSERDGSVTLWRKAGSETVKLTDNEGGPPRIAFSPDGKWLSVTTGLTARVVSITDTSHVHDVAIDAAHTGGEDEPIVVLGWTPGGILVVVVEDEIVAWSSRTAKALYRERFPGLESAKLSPTGLDVAVAHGACTVMTIGDRKRVVLEPL